VGTSQPDVKTMKLRFAGTCAGCGAAVDTGQRAHYLRASKAVRCLTCGPTASTEPTVIAGASADREAARAAEQAQQLAAKHAAAERRASAFAAGAEGERIVAEALAPLSAAGYILLHDRAAGPRANLDHLVVGPSGVWLVNAKHWSGTVTAEGVLRHNGRARTRQLERSVEERSIVEGVLTRAGVQAPVRGVFAFTSAAPEPTSLQDVDLLPVERLRAAIGAAAPVLDGRTVDRAAAALVTALPPAGETEYAPQVSDAELPEDLRDEGAYLFLEHWSRPGKSRLYVHRFGQCFGYVDLINRSCHVESSHERAQPNLEFVLEWFADVDAEPKQIGRLGRLAMWVAGGAPRRAVAVRFRRRNIDRLYVHLADGTRRTQIGYFDLLKNQVHAAEPEFAAIVTKAAAVRAAAATSE
jgi:hypothetical protein